MEAVLRLNAYEKLIGLGERAEGEAELKKASTSTARWTRATIATIEALLASTQSESA